MRILISEKQLNSLISLIREEESYDKEYVDSILDKIISSGIDSLSPKEREYLEKVSNGDDNFDDELVDKLETNNDDVYSFIDSLDRGNLSKLAQPKDNAENLLKILFDNNLIGEFGAEKDNEISIYLYSFKINNEDVYLGDGSMRVIVTETTPNLTIYLDNDGLTEEEYRRAVLHIQKLWVKRIKGLNVVVIPYGEA